jgi:hypothetical protein
VRKDKKEDMKKKCELFKGSKKAFYGYIRSKQKVSNKIQQLQIVEKKDEFTTGEKEAADQILQIGLC